MSLTNAKRVDQISQIKRIVVKVGSSTLTYPNGLLNFSRIESIVRQLSDIRNSGKEVILVSSGAVAAGITKQKAVPLPSYFRMPPGNSQ